MDAEMESFLLLVLSDGNLPTGSFVASSGLEAYVKHGFFSLSTPGGVPKDGEQNSEISLDLSPPTIQLSATINFIRDSVQSYAHTTLPYITATYDVCDGLKAASESSDPYDQPLVKFKKLDELYEATTLNHVARRASTSQGVALLTLLLKGLAEPSWINKGHTTSNLMENLAEKYKLEIRRGSTPGHLPICWSVLTSALGLSCGELCLNL